MDVSAQFLDVLKCINYHFSHLPRDLFANEQRVPELAPIFAWFINNVSPKKNCVTPKELKLYASLSSKHDHFSSLEKVFKAIEKFYDESTIDSTVGPSDLDSLEKEIQNSQQELNDLNALGILYQKKLHELDNDVSLLKEKYNSISTQCYQIENNMHSVLKSLKNDTVAFGLHLKTLHDGIEDSMTNDDLNLPKLVSNNLLDLNESFREQICKMIQAWFKEKNIPSKKENEELKTFQTILCMVFKSITLMQQAEINANSDVLKLNLALRNVSGIRNYYYNHQEILLPNGLDLSNYIKSIKENQEIPMLSNHQQLTSNECDIKSRFDDLVVSDAENKLSDLQTTNSCITFVRDSVDHYNMINDVVHCLMKVHCSIENVKCELVLNCIRFLEKMVDDISFDQNWVSSNAETVGQKTIVLNSVVKFSGYSLNCTYLDEVEKLAKMVQQWKSKYHFSREESYKLTAIQQKLQAYSETINKLV